MRGDETQPARVSGGPRHAAPRKTLLNRIQGPAGKAMALAAMPTAVLVGMGLTPKLALADEGDIPFAPGPCVTRSDEPAPEKTTASPAPSAEPTGTAKPEPTGTPTPSATATGTPSAPPTATGTPAPTATPTATATTGTAGGAQEVTERSAPAPTATATPTQSKNPLDPLGVGDALKDLFGGLAPKPTATTAPAATAAPAPATAAPTAAPTTAPAQRPAAADEEPAGGTKAGTGARSTTDADAATARTKAAIEEAAEKAGATVEELPERAKGLEPKKDEDIPEGAKPRFPCPEPDPEALAAAELEEGIPLLPDEPWRLDSTLLTLKGLRYHGIVEVKTYSGKIKKVLKFTSSGGIDIKDLHQTTEHSEGYKGHVRSNPGSTSTITDGTVTMYTESLKGKLFGIIPVTFSPETPPPLDVPLAIFSDVTVMQAGQFGGTLKVPGLRNTIEPG